MRTFDDLIRTALVDIAAGAVEPADLADAALADAARQRRLMIPTVAGSAVLVFGAGLLISFAFGGHSPSDGFQPDGRPATRHNGPARCASPSPVPCVAGTAGAETAASQSPSPTTSRSRRATPSPAATATPSVDSRPGNRPHPKPTKPGRGDDLDVSVIPDGL